jgi:branched-chain amino acid transport system permease protein
MRLSTGLKGAWVDAIAMAAMILAVALLISVFGGAAWQRVGANAMILLTAVLALQLFSGNTGIVSFGHAGFMGLGAYTVGILTMSPQIQASALKDLPAFLAGHQLDLAAALMVVVALGLVVGVITGLPLTRLSGSSASIATLALLIIVVTVLIAAREITRGSQPFYGVPRNVGLWTAAAIAALALVGTRVFRELPVGLAARACAADERGAASVGVDRRIGVLVTWTASVAIAMVAGGLLAQFLGAFKPQDFYFDLAFETLAMLIVGGMGSVLGGLAGVGATVALIEVVRRLEEGGSLLGVDVPPIFGLTEAALAVAIILIIWRRPEGLCGGRELELLRRLRGRPAVAPAAEPPSAGRDASIRTHGLTKHYAGVAAVEEVSVALPANRITGLIGPNGAGKTSFLNLVSGHVAASRGTIAIGGHAVVRPTAHHMARLGIARTFQNIRIFPGMTVLENVVVAARQVEPSLLAAEAAAMRELARLGLAEEAGRLASTLPYGLRRRLEVARALALQPSMLLLDEPAAGMNAVETAELMRVLAEVRARRQLGIVLVEHDLRLVMSLCEHIIVLDHGRVIAEGAPAEVRANPEVIRAYLGSRTGDRILQGGTGIDNQTKGNLSHA